jgi:hypothetical protein
MLKVRRERTPEEEARANGREGTQQSDVSRLLFPQCPCDGPEKQSPAPATDGEPSDRPDPDLNHSDLQVPGLRPRVGRNHSPVNLLGNPWTWGKETGPGLGKAPPCLQSVPLCQLLPHAIDDLRHHLRFAGDKRGR